MKNKNKNKKIFNALLTLCAALVLMGGFSVTAYAQTPEGQDDATDDSGVVYEEPEKEEPLTPDGNATLVDDFGGNKQLITVTTKNGNYFYILIDRVAAIAALKGCSVMVLLNKCDLDCADALYAVYAAAGFPTLRVSAETGEGIEELKPLIAGKLSAFTGNSGVGKSSILNALDPAFQLQVGDVSQALGRGRHTTRHVELFHLSCGADVVDSPGFSSFETDELNLELKHRLPETFVEFRPYLDQCRFVGCSHTKEKGCAVLEAVRAGKIQRSRHASYVRLYEELKSLQDWQERKK